MSMSILNIKRRLPKADYRRLWEGIRQWSRRAGRSATRPVLLLWFVMTSPSTPLKDKLTIFTSIAYLVLPVSLLNGKKLPVIGWIDEIMSLAIAVQKMSRHITPEMQLRAEEILDRWFTEYADYEIITGETIFPDLNPPAIVQDRETARQDYTSVNPQMINDGVMPAVIFPAMPPIYNPPR